MNPGFGTPVLANYGNSQSGSGGSMPMIDNITAPDIPRSQMHPPTLTTAPVMPFIERITPRSLNAGKSVSGKVSVGRVRATLIARHAWQTSAGYGRAARMRAQRFFQDIGTPLWSK